MPRHRPNRSNGALPTGPVEPVSAPALPPTAATGQDYGAAGAQLAAQAAMPLPNAVAVDPMAAAEEQAAAMPPPGPPLGSPSQRPNEPVTAGLASGPGPGPEILGLGATGRVTQLFDELASATGDSFLREMAEHARNQGV